MGYRTRWYLRDCRFLKGIIHFQIRGPFFFLEAFCDISHRLGGITPFGVFSDASRHSVLDPCRMPVATWADQRSDGVATTSCAAPGRPGTTACLGCLVSSRRHAQTSCAAPGRPGTTACLGCLVSRHAQTSSVAPGRPETTACLGCLVSSHRHAQTSCAAPGRPGTTACLGCLVSSRQAQTSCAAPGRPGTTACLGCLVSRHAVFNAVRESGGRTGEGSDIATESAQAAQN
jgi:hypothetical protein